MPTKRNKAGNQQNYVPKGNGDASGEYGDNATGSNKHFTNFAKGGGENKVDNAEKKFEEKSNRIAERNKEFSNLVDGAERKEIYATYKNRQLKTFSVDEYNNKEFKSYVDMYSYFKVYGITDLNKEQRKKFVELSCEDILDCLDLPSYSTEEDYLSLLPESYEGTTSMMRKLFFGNNDEDRETWVYQRVFKEMYNEEIKEISDKVKDKINEKREGLGKKYIQENFKKVNNGFGMEDALKMANPQYKENEFYRINCQRCCFTYELLRRGYDVSAKPNIDGFGKNNKWTSQMCWKETHNITSATYKGAKKEIEEIVKKAGNGARYCIGADWKGSGGHCFIAENINGEVKFLDAQMGRNDCTKYFERIQSKAGIFLGRMDNAEFSQSVMYTAKGKENDKQN